MKKQDLRVILVCLVVLDLVVTSCRRPTGEGQGENKLEGTITVSGAWALYPLMVRWGEEFQKSHPNVRIDISAGGAGKGMADTLAGAVDIGMVSREIYPQEIEKGAFWVSVTKDAVFLTVNENNPVWEDLRKIGVTRDIIYRIYITGEITTWGQVIGQPQVTDPIHVFTRSDAAGAPATWAAYLGKMQEDLLGIGVYGDPGLLEAVIKDPQSIGYNNLNFAFDPNTGKPVAGAHVVSIDINGNSQVDPEEVYDTKEQAVYAVASGNYPSPPARDLNLVTRGMPTGLVRTFITWVLTEGQEYVTEAGYIPLTQDKLDEGLNKLE